jgi:hypothetical protein
MIQKLIIALCITFAFTQSCKKKSTPSPLKSGVYIAGTVKQNNTVWPVYWKDGEVHKIGSGSYFSRITSIATSGNNIYVGGYLVDSQSTEQAVYWRNDSMVKLMAPGFYARIFDITVVGNDVYIYGGYGNSSTSITLCYWKNNVKTDLVGAGEWLPGKMHVVNGDVYTCCTQLTGGNTFGFVHKNGVFLFYDSYTTMNDILFANGQVNIAGSEDSAGIYKPAVWKSSARTKLPSTGNGGNAFCIAVAGNDVYVGGYSYTIVSVISTIWKNNVASEIAISPKHGEVNCIKVEGSNIHACGNASPTNLSSAAYFKNNTLISLDPNKIYTYSTANDMVIVQ